MELGDGLLVAGACFVASSINAVAGGGTLVSFPALIATGLDPVAANVTNTLAIWPGYLGGSAALRRHLGEGDRSLPRLALAAGLGAVVGSALLLLGDPDVFEAIVPFLVLGAAGLLAVPPSWLERLRRRAADRRQGAAFAGVALAGVYGAYFGGGLGVIVLAVLNALLGGDLRALNATKAVLALLINTVALVAFVSFGPVAWDAVAVGAPLALVGGFAGGRLSARLHPPTLRKVVIAFATAVGVALLLT